MTDTELRNTANNLRRLASDQKLKVWFTSKERRSANEVASAIMSALVYPESDSLSRQSQARERAMHPPDRS
jgi:hypothetical protein